MEQSIQDNGIQASEMVLVVKCGQMVQGMKAIGNLIKLTAKANLSMLTVIFTREVGLKTIDMEWESWPPLMAISTKAIL